MCTSLEIDKLNNPTDIFPAYKKAYERKDGINTILVEYDYYNEKVMIISKHLIEFLFLVEVVIIPIGLINILVKFFLQQ